MKNKKELKLSDEEFGLEDDKFYFKDEVSKSSSIFYFLMIVLIAIFFYIIQINWLNLNQYNQIKSQENYPVEQIFKEQISFYGIDYPKFKNESGVNYFLKGQELDKYWNNCIGSCEMPSTDRFTMISSNQSFINWACNERVKEDKYSATKYAMWKLNKQGCVLTNLNEVIQKDKEEIKELKWQKQKEMEIYLVILLIIFLVILSILKKIIKNK